MDLLLPDVPLESPRFYLEAVAGNRVNSFWIMTSAFFLSWVNDMDQPNQKAQSIQDNEHNRHIDQHDDERIRCHRMSH